jgi:arabinofuranosyltransferase
MPTNNPRSENIFFYSLCAAGFIFLLCKSWIGEDAFITARVIDNFINGYGLRWNVDERVEVFTHPLWMMLQIPFYYITNEFFYTNIAISLICTIAAIIVCSKLINTSKTCLGLFLIVPLICTRAWSDYATSGLENPLTYLLIAFFCYTLWGKNRTEALPWFSLTLITALALLNRLDLALIFVPIMLFLFICHFKQKKLAHIIAGSLPLVSWEAFSFIYYGFMFPNTKYAKLDAGHSTADLIDQGLTYFLNFAATDSAGALVICLSCTLLIFSKHPRKIEMAMLLCGVGFYITYILIIGGGYMSGRFFTAPIFTCLIILNLIIAGIDIKRIIIIPAVFTICFACSTAYIFSKHNVFTDDNDSSHFIDPTTQIHDERGWSWQTNHLISAQWLGRGKDYTQHRFSIKGTKLKNRASPCELPPCHAVEYYAMGMAGYTAGPAVTIIDLFALTDPLLSRIKQENPVFAPGHYFRQPPLGYTEFRKTGNTQKINPYMLAYVNNLRLITSSDDLFNEDRLEAIYLMNFTDELDSILNDALIIDKRNRENDIFNDAGKYEIDY